MNSILKFHPAVCPVGKNYQIMVITWCDALISVKVGDKLYYNHSNGIRISRAGVHKFTVPVKELDREHSYTIIAQAMIERSPYYPRTAEAIETKYNFRPIEKTEDIKIYHLADVHGWAAHAILAAEYFNEQYDILILNGDISNTSNTFEDITLCYNIASDITKGEFPCIISRGNHDLRGYAAETLTNYMPTDNGNSYYSFKVGCIWGLLVDTGEDKVDSSKEYGGTICCHEFRLEQEQMILDKIKNASFEYEQDDIKYKLVISHVPFTFYKEPKFDIEKDLYTKWASLIKENIKPNLMLCGHTHEFCVSKVDDEYDALGNPCTVIVGSNVNSDINDTDNILAGAFIKLNPNVAEVKFNTKEQIIGEDIIQL